LLKSFIKKNVVNAVETMISMFSNHHGDKTVFLEKSELKQAGAIKIAIAIVEEFIMKSSMKTWQRIMI